jgi:predicted nucleotidyltransferase component of viral defense system
MKRKDNDSIDSFLDLSYWFEKRSTSLESVDIPINNTNESEGNWITWNLQAVVLSKINQLFSPEDATLGFKGGSTLRRIFEISSRASKDIDLQLGVVPKDKQWKKCHLNIIPSGLKSGAGSNSENRKLNCSIIGHKLLSVLPKNVTMQINFLRDPEYRTADMTLTFHDFQNDNFDGCEVLKVDICLNMDYLPDRWEKRAIGMYPVLVYKLEYTLFEKLCAIVYRFGKRQEAGNYIKHYYDIETIIRQDDILSLWTKMCLTKEEIKLLETIKSQQYLCDEFHDPGSSFCLAYDRLSLPENSPTLVYCATEIQRFVHSLPEYTDVM